MKAFKLVCLLLTICISFYSNSHALKETTATLTARSGHIHVVINTDMSRLLTLLHDQQAWLLGDISVLLTALQKPSEKLSIVKQIIEKQTKVMVNKSHIPCQLVKMPTSLPNHKAHHHRRGIFQLECKNINISEQASIFVTLPNILGQSLITFLQPRQKMTKPGGVASFKMVTY